MTDVAAALKAEIARISRKQIRASIEPLRKALAGQRSDAAALKKRAEVLERQVRHLARAAEGAEPLPAAEDEAPTARRFSAKGLAAQRKRLGLSAADCGRLLGASGQSVYNWESGTARPQARHMEALAAFRTLTKKGALAQLEAMRQSG